MSFLDLTDDKELSFELLPRGVYDLIVTDAEETVTKAGNKRINLTFTVSSGDHIGRKIFEGYNLTGENAKAVQISRGQLKALWKCAGHQDFVISSVDKFLNLEVTASVKVQEGKDGYEPKNVISTFKPKAAVKTSESTPF